MDLLPHEYLLLGMIIFAASIIQGTVGFAAGLFGIPLMVMLGLDPSEAIMISLLGSFFQSSLGAYRLRNEIDIRTTLRPTLIRFIGLPLGVMALAWFDSLPQQTVKQAIGAILLTVLLVQRLWQVEPRERLHSGWEWLAFSLSGFMAGFCGIGGPAMVLWVMAHQWSAGRSRAFMFHIFAAGMLPQAGLMYARFGEKMIRPTLIGLLGILIMLAGTQVGLMIGARLPKQRLRQITFGLLVMIALSALISPLLQSSSSGQQDATFRETSPNETGRSLPFSEP